MGEKAEKEVIRVINAMESMEINLAITVLKDNCAEMMSPKADDLSHSTLIKYIFLSHASNEPIQTKRD